MKISVVISTYNSPLWLEKVLWGYECQTFKDFELVIADDGSGESTKNLIKEFKKSSSLTIIHVWHKDDGFQKTRILNKAILAAKGDYLIFSDGDCIPRVDFVAVHAAKAKPGYFLSGGYFMLPASTSHSIAREDIANGNAFKVEWLRAHGLKPNFKINKLTSSGLKERFLNFITPTKATWNGHNASGWKSDILSVNGFNETMQYGGEDRELGERLINKGIRGIQIRYSAICIHLDHERGYNTPESIAKNRKIRSETRRFKKIWTEDGILKSDQFQ